MLSRTNILTCHTASYLRKKKVTFFHFVGVGGINVIQVTDQMLHLQLYKVDRQVYG